MFGARQNPYQPVGQVGQKWYRSTTQITIRGQRRIVWYIHTAHFEIGYVMFKKITQLKDLRLFIFNKVL